MDLSFIRDCLFRIRERKVTLLVIASLFLVGIVLGIAFARTPAFYDYQQNLCDRYLYRVCYSDRSVFVIFLERTAGASLLLLITGLSGVHVAVLAVPCALLLYRSYTFGGSIAILFGVYGVSGAVVALVLYIPVHLLIDAALIASTALSFGRARCFHFHKQDVCALLLDLLALFLLIAAVCLLEAILLLAIFHPLGNLF